MYGEGVGKVAGEGINKNKNKIKNKNKKIQTMYKLPTKALRHNNH